MREVIYRVFKNHNGNQFILLGNGKKTKARMFVKKHTLIKSIRKGWSSQQARRSGRTKIRGQKQASGNRLQKQRVKNLHQQQKNWNDIDTILQQFKLATQIQYEQQRKDTELKQQKQQNEEMIEEEQKYEEEGKQIKKTIRTTRSQFNEQITQLEQKTKNQITNLQQLQVQVDQSRRLNDEITEQIEQKRQRIIQLEKQLLEKEQEQNIIQELNKQITEENDQQQKLLHAQKQNYKDLQDKFQDLEDQNTQLKKNQEHELKYQQELQSQLKDNKDIKKQLLQEKIQDNQKLQEIDEENQSLKKQIKQSIDHQKINRIQLFLLQNLKTRINQQQLLNEQDNIQQNIQQQVKIQFNEGVQNIIQKMKEFGPHNRDDIEYKYKKKLKNILQDYDPINNDENVKQFLERKIDDIKVPKKDGGDQTQMGIMKIIQNSKELDTIHEQLHSDKEKLYQLDKEIENIEKQFKITDSDEEEEKQEDDKITGDGITDKDIIDRQQGMGQNDFEKPLSNTQIDKIVKQLGIKDYIGTFEFNANTISEQIQKNGEIETDFCFIVNTAKIKDPDSKMHHWVAFYFQIGSKNRILYYDSLNDAKVKKQMLTLCQAILQKNQYQFMIEINYNKKSDQPATQKSQLCGLYAINFINLIYNGFSKKHAYQPFDDDADMKNDEELYKMYKKYLV